MTVEELTMYVEKVVKDHDKRLSALEEERKKINARFDDQRRTNDDLDRKIAVNLEAGILYYKMISDKLNEVLQKIDSLHCAQCDGGNHG